jgi:hypothetical protein
MIATMTLAYDVANSFGATSVSFYQGTQVLLTITAAATIVTIIATMTLTYGVANSTSMTTTGLPKFIRAAL